MHSLRIFLLYKIYTILYKITILVIIPYKLYYYKENRNITVHNQILQSKNKKIVF